MIRQTMRALFEGWFFNQPNFPWSLVLKPPTPPNPPHCQGLIWLSPLQENPAKIDVVLKSRVCKFSARGFCILIPFFASPHTDEMVKKGLVFTRVRSGFRTPFPLVLDFNFVNPFLLSIPILSQAIFPYLILLLISLRLSKLNRM